VNPILAIEPPTPIRRRDDLDELYGRHLAQVKRWARRLAGPTADLEDLVHDIFLIALRKPFDGSRGARVDTWLFEITRNVVRGSRRKQRVREWIFGRNQHELTAPEVPTPLGELERMERCERLYRALDRLPEDYRTLLILYEIDQLPGDEVARLLGMSIRTMWVRLHRGRKRLQKFLETRERESQP
jgi:RNA polymerase sigma-70 factor (ECF subfamily)